MDRGKDRQTDEQTEADLQPGLGDVHDELLQFGTSKPDLLPHGLRDQ